MLATPGQLPTGGDWRYELKWDGVRAIVSFDGRTDTPALRIESRRGLDNTGQFPELGALRGALAGHDAVLDGEVVAFDPDGRPSFNRLQHRLGVTGLDAARRAAENPVVLAVFDLLHLDGYSTRDLPFRDRRRLLETLLDEPGPSWRLSTVHEDGAALRAATAQADLEGVVAKRASSRYQPGVRSPAWIKVKNLNTDDFLIGGWVPGEGRREGTIGALLLGLAETDAPDAPLRFVGKVGTGFTDAMLEHLRATLEPDRQHASPFSVDTGERVVVYVAPRRSARVEYREWTPTGTLRFPSFKGLVEE